MKIPLHTIAATLIGFVCGGGAVWAKGAPAAAPAAPAPPAVVEGEGEPVTVRFENEAVRVFEVRLPPGGKVGMHSHPARIAMPLAPYKMKFSYPDGTSKILERNGTEVAWHEGTTHAAENIGTTEFRVMVTEVKCAAVKSTNAKAEAKPSDAPPAAKPGDDKGVKK